LDNKRKKLTSSQKEISDNSIKFYPPVINKTNIVLSNEEQTVVNKGLKYNLSYKQRDWIKTLATEAETPIIQLPISE